MVGDLRRIALHEAAHAVVSIRLGQPIVAASIRPGEGYRGIVTASDIPWPGGGPARTIVEAAIERRIAIERTIVIALAGRLGERFATPFTGYLAEDDEAEAEGAALALAELSPRAFELLGEIEGSPTDDVPSDDERAFFFATRLAEDEAAEHISLMRAVAVRLVDELAEPIRRVARVLETKTVLTGRQIRVLMAATPTSSARYSAGASRRRPPHRPGA